MTKTLKQIIHGEVDESQKSLEFYSHDTSLFEVRPQTIVFPKNAHDVMATVKYVNEHKKDQPELSITARSAGTCMSGGAINDSIIMVFERHMNKINDPHGTKIRVQPGAYYRDFEKKTLADNKILPSYPASRDLCALGGMISNNAGGEKSLIYGKTEDYVRRLKVVLSDGNEYTFRPLSEEELKTKLKKKDFEGKIYNKIYKLVSDNYDLLKKAKPNVSKNSTGYKLWDIWDKDHKRFDMTQLFVGAQGTLGLVTEADMGLVHAKDKSGLLVGYVKSTDQLADLVNTVVKHGPTSFETFDDHTFKFAIKFFFQFRKTLGWGGLVKLGLSFIPDLFILLRTGIPKLLVLVEFESDKQSEIDAKLEILQHDLKRFDMLTEIARNEKQSRRFWLMRRESFNLLRKNVHGRHTAPFIDDLVVPPAELPEFLPAMNKIIAKYGLLATVAGHMGDGNFHIIPLMDLTDETEREKIEPCLMEVLDLVKKHGGTLSGEHNDGLIRSPFLGKMYPSKINELFREVKNIMDPDNIFNPHKKTDATWEFSKAHMRDHF